MKSILMTPEEERIVAMTMIPGSDKQFLAEARKHPKSIVLTYYRAMHAAAGHCTRKNVVLAKRLVKSIIGPIMEAAEKGDAIAQNCMGILYSDKAAVGLIVPQDFKEAVKWFRRSARQGHMKGQLNLGECYRKGEGVPKSFARAAMWYGRAAAQGCWISASQLGLLYHKGGFGLRQDYAKCFKWVRQAAAAGSVGDIWFLGTLYAHGRGVRKSIKKSVELYRKAVDAGDGIACLWLSHCYLHGIGVEKDRAKSFELCKRSAEWGFPPAQYALGVGYLRGDECWPADRRLARYWLKKAAKQGHEKAKALLVKKPAPNT